MGKAEYEGYLIETESDGTHWRYVISKDGSPLRIVSPFEWVDDEDATMAALSLITSTVAPKKDDP